MSLYLWLDLLSLSVPFLVSFHPRIALYKEWKALFMALLITMVPFIIWDVYFTVQGYWGFNSEYLAGINLWHLPVEEWLFFICIPYACVFTHISILEINPNLKLSKKTTQIISGLLFLLFFVVFITNYGKAYTAVDMIFAILVLGVVTKFNPDLLNSFYITFLFMLIPFFIVNGILTGTGIDGNIVWYNDDQNLGVRMVTIPVEDTVYAFSMILLNLFLFYKFKRS
ncbi:lycopene cyclase domain-containing protein [Lutimonas sp.]|uniref:lycopene cyclase domain-containing protein n=1 Tax=Lutimonas sp. TaxID=1872403 RepID=UPI003D9B0642